MGKCATDSKSGYDKNWADSINDSIQLCLLHCGKRASGWWEINSIKPSLLAIWSQNNAKTAKIGQSDRFIEFIAHQPLALFP